MIRQESISNPPFGLSATPADYPSIPRLPDNVQGGFTISELLVVISLVAILVGTMLPATSVVRSLVASESAAATISAAVTTARAYATVSSVDLKNNGDPAFGGFDFSGAAAVFTPACEIRLVANDQSALDGLVNLESLGQNGYTDIPGREYMKLPRDSGIVGIARNSNGADPELLTPPFAVRFDQLGRLIAGIETAHWVYYDGLDYDGSFDRSSTRPATYNPDDWDPTFNTVSMSKGRYLMPFEQVESVIGVVVYSKRQLLRAGENHDGNTNGINAAARDWILANGQTILFSRNTGTMIKK